MNRLNNTVTDIGLCCITHNEQMKVVFLFTNKFIIVVRAYSMLEDAAFLHNFTKAQELIALASLVRKK